MVTTFTPSQVVLGENSLETIGKIVKQQRISHLFVVMDHFLTTDTLGYDQKIKKLAEQENVKISFFTDYQGEPTTNHVENALHILKKQKSDGVLAVGGGSAIDIAKAVSLFAVNPDLKWEEIVQQERLQRLPLIALPTTAGTGSEATKVMVIKDSHTEFKMNPGHRDLIPDVAVLDPNVTTSLPIHFTAYTGMDALTHAIEAYVSTKANPITDHYALEAIKIIGKSLPIVYENGEDVNAREKMLLASYYAGVAFSNASTNLAHAAGRPLGARFNIPHGLSVSLLLPFVIEFGLEAAPERYAGIALALGGKSKGADLDKAKTSIEIIKKFNSRFGIWEDGLKYINLPDLQKNIGVLVDDALSGNGITTNRKLPSGEDVEQVYLDLLEELRRVKEREGVAK